MVCFLLGIAIAARIAYVAQFLDSPCREWHRWPDSDLAFFDEWSRDIASGQWLQRAPRHPFHSWHAELAKESLRQTQGSSRDISPEFAARTLWNRWYGGTRFHQEPLYPYFLAILRCVTNHATDVILGLQLVAGLVSILLIWDISRRCFGPVTGLVAGFLAALSPTLLYLDLVLLRESFITCSGLGLVWLAMRGEARNTRGAWSILGLACGIALLLKVTLALFALGCGVNCLLRVRRHPGALVHLALFSGALLLGISPAIMRNLVVGAPTFSLSSVATITFINTNAADSDPLGFPISWDHAPRIMRESQGSFPPAVLATWRTHTPASYLRLIWQKWRGLWNWFEAPDNISFAFFRLQMPILGWLPITFTIIGPLSLVGLALGLVRRDPTSVLAIAAEAPPSPPLWPLYLLVGNHMLALMLFTQVGRLRVPLAAALVPFAALTLVRLGEWLAGESRVKGTVTLVVLVLVGCWTFTGTPAGFTEYRAADFQMAYELHFNPRITKAAEQENWAQVAHLLEESLQHEPLEIRELRTGSKARNRHQFELAQVFANAHASYATVLEKLHRTDSASNERRRSEELKSVWIPAPR